MHLPAIHGLIRRRILVNFRVDPEVMQRQLPRPLRPKLLGDAAIAGVCLIRLEALRPRFVGVPFGFASENAAHRVAVCWTDEHGRPHEGVYIARRDTGSRLIHLAGGRVFPGEHQRAAFAVRDEAGAIDVAMRSADGAVAMRVQGRDGETLPESSRFPSLEAASAFFEAGAHGYSATSDGERLDGLCLRTRFWRVRPLVADAVEASYFADEQRFPCGSVAFDCALIMRDIPHEWQPLPDLRVSSLPR